MNAIGELRRKLGLTQAALAEKAGVGVNTIARYERGEMQPSLKNAHVIARVLGCTEAELLSGQARQEFEVKIVMGVKNLTNLAGVTLTDNSFFYGVDDNEPQIVMMGKVGIATPEERENALAEIVRKFKAACWMFDHKADAEADTEAH